ncbi:LytR/AlgR family response regulator transcription factor [Chitinophaga sp. RAB17]|uniref:LytR/AlgR family response regulator transcription factor n=1 Tax=Chitinophaga sp. RAB17 TaxID=3233049 RepID=UPI003F919C47
MKTIVIVEDEANIRNDLLLLLRQYKDIEIAGAADTVQRALGMVQKKMPDVLLLDIQLGGQTAFDLLNELEHPFPHLIFITGYDQYAIKAIKYGALDYLLKPVNEQELIAAITKATVQPSSKEIRKSLQVAQASLKMDHAPTEIVLRTQQTIDIVPFKDILFCSSSGCYTTFHLQNRKLIVVSKPMKIYEELLPEGSFLKPHQSYLVNRSFIKGYHRDGYLLLHSGDQVPVSVRKREQVMSHFNR